MASRERYLPGDNFLETRSDGARISSSVCLIQ